MGKVPLECCGKLGRVAGNSVRSKRFTLWGYLKMDQKGNSKVKGRFALGKRDNSPTQNCVSTVNTNIASWSPRPGMQTVAQGTSGISTPFPSSNLVALPNVVPLTTDAAKCATNGRSSKCKLSGVTGTLSRSGKLTFQKTDVWVGVNSPNGWFVSSLRYPEKLHSCYEWTNSIKVGRQFILVVIGFHPFQPVQYHPQLLLFISLALSGLLCQNHKSNMRVKFAPTIKQPPQGSTPKRMVDPC